MSQDVHLWLVGEAPGDGAGYVGRLLELAHELGVKERVLITGYVSEAELDLRLAAIDVGLCPYLDAAASGSLSTLLGARRPVVVSDIPLTRELRGCAPQAIVIANTAQPDALAATVQGVLEHPPDASAFDAVLADRSPAVTAQRYLLALCPVAARVSPGRRGNRAHGPGNRGAQHRQSGAIGELMADEHHRKRN
jgi:glycosyltransferase involved in cell wall biosynthesis